MTTATTMTVTTATTMTVTMTDRESDVLELVAERSDRTDPRTPHPWTEPIALTPAEQRRLRSMLSVLDARAERLPSLRKIGDLSGVAPRLLRRRFRTSQRLVEHIVESVIDSARPLVTHGRRPVGSVYAVVRMLVGQRTSVHDAVADVLPFVFDRGCGAEAVDALHWSLRSELEFQLRSWLGDVTEAERLLVVGACDDALSLAWIDVLRSGQGRSKLEVDALLTGHVMNVLAAHGVAVRRIRRNRDVLVDVSFDRYRDIESIENVLVAERREAR
jgi:hypothetical protein